MRLRQILQIIVLLSYHDVTARNFDVYSQSSAPSLQECITKVTDLYFLQNETVWIALSTGINNYNSIIWNSSFLFNLHSHSHSILITLKNYQEHKYFQKRMAYYILETESDEDLKNTMQVLRLLQSWNSHGKFLVVLTATHNETREVAVKMIEVLWFEGIYNFAIAAQDAIHPQTINFFAWFPYSVKNCRHDYSTLTILDSCFFGKFHSNSNLFPEKIPRNFHQCPLSVGAVIWPPYVMEPARRIANTDQYIIKNGFEVILLQEIANKMNLNVSYHVSEKALNWGDLHENGTATGLMALLMQKTVDLGASSLAITESRYKYLDFTQSYFFESFSWCVPHATVEASWRKIFDPVSYEIWILFFIAFIFHTIMLWALSQREEKETIYKNFYVVIQNSFSMVLGMAVHQPKTFTIRLISIFWIFFSFNFDTLYETQLISVLTKPTYVTQINTLEKILQSNLRLQFLHNTKSYFDGNSSMDLAVLHRWTDCTDIDKCLERVAFTKDSSMCVSTTYMNYIRNRYVTRENLPLIYCFPADIVSYPVVFLMRKGFPLGPAIDRVRSQLECGGFVTFWTSQIFDRRWMQEKKESVNNNTVEKFLNMEKLQTAFTCLLIGLTASFLVFIGEVALYMHEKLKGRKIIII